MNNKLLDVLNLIYKYAELSKDYEPRISNKPWDDDTDLNLEEVVREFKADYKSLERDMGEKEVIEIINFISEAHECINMLKDSGLYPLLRELGIDD